MKFPNTNKRKWVSLNNVTFFKINLIFLLNSLEELELYRQKVAAEHQQRIKDHEEKLRQIQKERQAVFDDAFRNDLEEFKQKGHIPSKFNQEFNFNCNIFSILFFRNSY